MVKSGCRVMDTHWKYDLPDFSNASDDIVA
jgi:hypothetical protein